MIVAAFPMSRLYAAAFLSALARTLAAPLPGGARFLLKSHPRLDARGCVPGVTLPDWAAFTARPMTALLEEADGFVYAPQTASWWEAYARGVPVLKYLPDAVDIDSDDALPAGAIEICDSSNLRAALERLAVAPRRTPDLASQSEMFGPVDDDAWRDLIP